MRSLPGSNTAPHPAKPSSICDTQKLQETEEMQTSQPKYTEIDCRLNAIMVANEWLSAGPSLPHYLTRSGIRASWLKNEPDIFYLNHSRDAFATYGYWCDEVKESTIKLRVGICLS